MNFGFWVDLLNFGGQCRRGDLRQRVMGWCLAEVRKVLFGTTLLPTTHLSHFMSHCANFKVLFVKLCKLYSHSARSSHTLCEVLSHCATLCYTVQLCKMSQSVLGRGVERLVCRSAAVASPTNNTPVTLCKACHTMQSVVTLCNVYSHFEKMCDVCSM